MKLVKTTFAIIFAAFLSIGCSQSSLNIDEETALTGTDEISKDELSTTLKTVIVNYPVTAVNDDASTEEVNSDEQLGKIISRNTRPKIEFPFDITIDGEVFTIEGINDLRELLKRPIMVRPPFRLVFPLTVINADETTTQIADQEAFKAYRETLAEGVKPTFQFPISVQEKDGTIVTIESEEAFKAYRQAIKPAPRDPLFKLVFPLTVINADETTTEIADQEAFKAYRETLADGVKPTFQFPISVQEKDGTIVTIESEEAFKTYLESKREESKPEVKQPPFKLVFPLTVINADETTTEITDQEAFKAYRETLADGVKPTFQFPISIQEKDGAIVTIESEETFKSYLQNSREENRPPRKRR